MKVLFVVSTLSDNSLGRAYALWLLAEHLGWDSRIAATREGVIWGPLSDSPFSIDCVAADGAGSNPALSDLAKDCDLIIAVKPLPASFGKALKVHRSTRVPLLLDVDDPDLEAWMAVHSRSKQFLKAVLRPRNYWRAWYLRRASRTVPTIVSNPALGAIHGGAVVPHARRDHGAGRVQKEGAIDVVFVGTVRAHKGLPLLRSAIARLHGEGFRLTITDSPPPDARPWERFVGATDIEQGLELVKRSDVVVIPSTGSGGISRLQLPAKLMDGMMAGRTIVAADLPPIRWALDGAGELFLPDDEDALVSSLRRVTSPETRSRMGAAARQRALSTFEVSAVSRVFRAACEDAVSLRRR